MQSLALENYGTSELSFDEQRETDGGWWNYVVGAVGYFIIESMTNPKSSSDALLSGFNDSQK